MWATMLVKVLDPQPRCSEVLKELLSWIDRVDARPDGKRPACIREDGTPIFPEEGSENDLWWLAELSKRKMPTDVEQGAPEDGGDEDVGRVGRWSAIRLFRAQFSWRETQ